MIIEKRDDSGRFHCEDGPAWEFEDGEKRWYIHGLLFKMIDRYGDIYHMSSIDRVKYGTVLHSINGPAIERADGTKEWWVDGLRHRENGPAIDNPEKNIREWWVKGERHRFDGPAVESPEGNEWWFFGQSASVRGMKDIIERHELPSDWSVWTDEEKVLFRLAI